MAPRPEGFVPATGLLRRFGPLTADCRQADESLIFRAAFDAAVAMASLVNAPCDARSPDVPMAAP
jgi:hypothetical protein